MYKNADLHEISLLLNIGRLYVYYLGVKVFCLVCKTKQKNAYFVETSVQGLMLTVEHFGHNSKRYAWRKTQRNK